MIRKCIFPGGEKKKRGLKMMKRKWIVWIALLLAVILPVTVLAEKPTISTSNPLTFDTYTFSGKPIDSSILKKYDLIMVNLWAEWCPPCVRELPDLQKIYENYKNILILGAYVGSDPAAGVTAAGKAGVTYPLFNIPDKFFDYLIIDSEGRYSIPQTCFFNSKGYQLNSACVGSRSYEEWAAIVEELLPYVTESGNPDPEEQPTVSKPVIKTQPKDAAVKAGKKVTFKLKAKGEKLKYQWYYRTSPTAKWKKVSSDGKSAILTFKAKAKQNGYQYRCLVKNAAGKVYSKTVSLKVKKK